MKKYFVFLGVLLIFTSEVFAEENVMYCVEEVATGIVFDDGKWIDAPFKKERFTAKVLETQNYAGEPIVKTVVIRKTEYECDVPGFEDRSVCKPMYYLEGGERKLRAYLNNGGSFIFDNQTGRFTLTQTSVFGFTKGDDGNAEVVSAGTCEDF